MNFILLRYNLFIISILTFQSEVFSQNWNPVTAVITFKIKHLGSTADGSFKDFSGNIFFDQANISTSSIKATIDAKSFRTSINLRDEVIKGEDYFDAAKYPKISIASTKIEKNVEQNSYTGFFILTIKNVTKNIKIPFTFTKYGTKATFQGNFSINRTDFGVGSKSILIGNSVNISILVNTQQ